MDPDAAGFIVLATVSTVAMITSFSALMWAAVQDGRDEHVFRLGR